MWKCSSIYLLGLLTCAAVIVQAFASTSPNNNLPPWGTKPRGGHVGAKKANASSSSSSALSMSTAEYKESRSSSEKRVEIPSGTIHPLNDISDSSDDGEETHDLNGASAASAHKTVQPGKAKKTILESGGFADGFIPATYVAETNLPTDIGHFRIRAYRIDEFEARMSELNPLGASSGLGSEPCVIYCTDKPPFGSKGGELGGAKEVPVRIHDQCFTSEVFRSRR